MPPPPLSRLVPEMGHVSVDHFAPRPGVSLFFLSHMHTDHLTGLHDGWSAGTLFTSPLSRRMLLARFRLSKSRVVALDVDLPHHVGDGTQLPFTVRLIDANHCPGAVMFFMQGPFGNLLHTGDFRVHPDMLQPDGPLADAVGCHLVVDNTYCHPSCVFPPQAEALQEVLRIIETHKDSHRIVIGIDSLGKEEVLVAVAQQFKAKLRVSKTRFGALTQHLGLSPEHFELDASAAEATRDWTCSRCGALVYASKNACFDCCALRPGSGAGCAQGRLSSPQAQGVTHSGDREEGREGGFAGGGQDGGAEGEERTDVEETEHGGQSAKEAAELRRELDIFVVERWRLTEEYVARLNRHRPTIGIVPSAFVLGSMGSGNSLAEAGTVSARMEAEDRMAVRAHAQRLNRSWTRGAAGPTGAKVCQGLAEGEASTSGKAAAKGRVFRVSYSLHSSFEELAKFMAFLRPVSVLGVVEPHDSPSVYFRHCLTPAHARRLAASPWSGTRFPPCGGGGVVPNEDAKGVLGPRAGVKRDRACEARALTEDQSKGGWRPNGSSRFTLRSKASSKSRWMEPCTDSSDEEKGGEGSVPAAAEPAERWQQQVKHEERPDDSERDTSAARAAMAVETRTEGGVEVKLENEATEEREPAKPDMPSWMTAAAAPERARAKEEERDEERQVGRPSLVDAAAASGRGLPSWLLDGPRAPSHGGLGSGGGCQGRVALAALDIDLDAAGFGGEGVAAVPAAAAAECTGCVGAVPEPALPCSFAVATEGSHRGAESAVPELAQERAGAPRAFQRRADATMDVRGVTHSAQASGADGDSGTAQPVGGGRGRQGRRRGAFSSARA